MSLSISYNKLTIILPIYFSYYIVGRISSQNAPQGFAGDITAAARGSGTKVAISTESALPELVKVVSSLLQDAMQTMQDTQFSDSLQDNNISFENEQPISSRNNQNYLHGKQQNIEGGHSHTKHHHHYKVSSTPHVDHLSTQQTGISLSASLPTVSSNRNTELWEPSSPDGLLSPGSGSGSRSRRRAPPQPPTTRRYL